MASEQSSRISKPRAWLTYLLGAAALLFPVGAWLTSHHQIAPKVNQAWENGEESGGWLYFSPSAGVAIDTSPLTPFPRVFFQQMRRHHENLKRTALIWGGLLVAAFAILELRAPFWPKFRLPVVFLIAAAASAVTILWLWHLADFAAMMLPPVAPSP